MFDFYTSSLARSDTNNSRFFLVVYIFRQRLISHKRVAFPTNRVAQQNAALFIFTLM